MITSGEEGCGAVMYLVKSCFYPIVRLQRLDSLFGRLHPDNSPPLNMLLVICLHIFFAEENCKRLM